MASVAEHLHPYTLKAENPSFDIPVINKFESARSKLFFERMGRPEIGERLTSQKPWSYWTMEIYADYIKGQGGLGMLASDTLEVAKKLGLPMVFITPFYSVERSHYVEDFKQKETRKRVSPEERGFKKRGSIFISTNSDSEVSLDVCVRQEGSVGIITIYEPNIGELYQDRNNSDHRLFQEVALGFGGYKALKLLGIEPSMNQQLNEAPTVFAALARLDERVQQIQAENPDVESHAVFAKALHETRDKTIYTNHTLVQAVEAEFSLWQFDHFVLPNMKSDVVKEWLRKKIIGKGGGIKLSMLAIDLAGKKNGVSKIHAREASKVYKDYDGNDVSFEGVTNGISLDRWGDPDLLELYEEEGIIDEFGLPTTNFKNNLESMQANELRGIKKRGKARLVEVLRGRKDQYDKVVELPTDVKILNWRRRIAEYKRPGMMFEQPERFAYILEKENAHMIMSGNAHPSDKYMIRELERILSVIDSNPILEKRVHFIENYDEELSKAISQGADISINTPRVRDENTGDPKSTEACATGWMKDVLNNVVLVSTDDGGVADPTIEAEEKGNNNFKPAYLQIKGNSYAGEVDSMYQRMEEALQIVDSDLAWEAQIVKQHSHYLPIVSGARMEAHYLNLGFPLSSQN